MAISHDHAGRRAASAVQLRADGRYTGRVQGLPYRLYDLEQPLDRLRKFCIPPRQPILAGGEEHRVHRVA
ncbi:hypothetical protein D3C84_1163580 [compost metagenome]